MTLVLSLAVLLINTPNEKPIPDRDVLKRKILDNIETSAKALERYTCSIQEQVQELDKEGKVNKTERRELNRFYVNGFPIDRVIAKDGRPLKDSEDRKEQERVQREIRKYSSEGQSRKEADELQRRINRFVAAQQFLHGRREIRNGRNTLHYDLQTDPNFKPRDIEDRLMQAIAGDAALDEETGAPVEVHLRTTRDVKVGGGLLASLHKGFVLDWLRERQPDGLWITKLIDGNADLRAGLFFHPRVRFSAQTRQCRLFSVNSRDEKYGASEKDRTP